MGTKITPLLPVTTKVSGLVLMWKQLRAEWKSREKLTKEDLITMGDRSNEALRWRLTLLLALAYAIWIIFFNQAYCVMTMYLLAFCVHMISTGHFGVDIDYTSYHLLCKCFHSCPLLDDLSCSISEFKLWYLLNQLLLLGFFLTWIPYLRCPYAGPGMMFVRISFEPSKYARAARPILKRANLWGN